MYVSCQVSTSISTHFDLAEGAIPTALYSTQRLSCVEISTRRQCAALQRLYPQTENKH